MSPENPSAPTLDWNRRAALGVLFGAALLLVVGILWWRFGPQNGHAQDPNNQGTSNSDDHAPGQLFEGWGKPDLVIVVSGQMFGYLQPCGCSSPQKGGLARRFNFIQMLRDKGWPVVAVDAGDLAATDGAPHDQLRLKFTTAMESLNLMRYTAIGAGRSEFRMPLSQALAHYSLNNPLPAFVAANIANIDKNYPGMLHAYVVDDKQAPRVGVVGLIAKSRREELVKEKNPEARFTGDTAQAMKSALKGMTDKKAEFGILLLQGRERDLQRESDFKLDPSFEEAKACAQMAAEWRQKDPTLAPLHLIVRNCGPDLADPPAIASKIGDTAVIAVGHKGKHVGVVAAFRKGNGYTLKYQLVAIGPEYETPAGKEKNNTVMAAMEEYARKVKKANYMAQFARTMHTIQVDFPARYVGSERCGVCHEHAYNVWEKQPAGKLRHSHAYDTLENVKHPSLRHFDGECIACHTTGFDHKTGYYDPANFPDNPKQAAKHDVKLRHVGCENCHGPGSEHVRLEGLFASKPNNAAIAKDRALMHQLMNPHKATAKELDPKTPAELREALFNRRMDRIDFSCQKCHDQENDLHWNFKKKWPEVIHMTPREGKEAAAKNGK